MAKYSKTFYESQSIESVKNAENILPLVIDIINPKSVLDVGCGVGAWLSVFKKLGIENIKGIDGEWVLEDQLLIHKDEFIRDNLENPSEIKKEYDLVVSLEVAEHLSQEHGQNFIKFLTSCSKVVLFSAAIPNQGGTNHINENWPSYWINIFKKCDFVPVDCIRNNIWQNENIAPVYKQNIFLFVEKSIYHNFKHLNSNLPANLVHPETYILTTNNIYWKLRKKLAEIKIIHKLYNKLSKK
ncbi:MAG: class I SAM-dependent methyltransferase [Methanobrevibacter sp.]|jgi:SAM-dependent methyltransferase|nr:class I SAM-dependent methyltransferase [Methanobrevibacter sp.]